MIRVLHVVSHMDRAGIETILMNYYKNINKEKIQFDFLINKNIHGAYDDEIIKMGGNIYITCGLNPLNINNYKKQVKDILINNPEIKIIHGHNDAMQYPALKAAKEIEFPVIISHSHNTSIDFNLKWPIKMLYKNKLKNIANYYFGCGNDAGYYLFGDDIKQSENYLLMKNAIDISKFTYNINLRNVIRKRLDIDDDTYLIGHVGRFSNQKNHNFIIDIATDISKLNLNFKFLLIGSGELECKLKKLIEKRKLNKYFIFTGNIQNVNEYYQAMDLFILPSKYEGLCVAVIEAQTSGLQCLISEKVTNEVNITDLNTFIPLKKELWVNEIINKSNKHFERRNMSKQIIDADYDIKSQSKKLEELYINMVKKHY